jgi:hypothetical protein
MNSEPVAWMAVNELNGSYSTFTNDQKQKLLPHVSQCYGKWIPLHTHSAKTLTDEELFKVYADLEEVYTGNNFPVDLGRAILRKAQEK